MKTAFGAAMSAATALTRQGRLNEATALIQRAFARAGLRESWAGRAAKRASPAPARDKALGARGPTRETVEPVARTFSYRSLVRTYEVFAPPTTSAAPGLVVMLHGCTQDPADFARGTRMNEAAAKNDCIVLYPAQSRGANANKCWNWFERDHQRRDEGEAGLIAHLTRHVIDEYGVDPRRVYVAGLSAGGAMAAVLADTYPELYAAACIHSGLPADAASSLPEALRAMRSGPVAPGTSAKHAGFVPTIVFHGTQDRTVHTANADVAVSSALARSTQSTTPEATESRDAKKRRVTKTTHRDAHGLALVEDWRVHSDAHAWFGGAPTGSYTDAHAIDATGEMMRFFAEHPRESTTKREHAEP